MAPITSMDSGILTQRQWSVPFVCDEFAADASGSLLPEQSLHKLACHHSSRMQHC